MRSLTETIELTCNRQQEPQDMWSEDHAHERGLPRKTAAVEQVSAASPLPAYVWHCSEYDF